MAILVFPGKGGTGKTTLSALTVKYFAEREKITLALDLDPDSHLYKLLGVKINKTIGDVVDRVHKEKKAELEPKKPVDVSDQEYFLSLIAEEVLIESENFDLLTLGKPSIDIDCYCPVFLWSQYAISQVMKSYGVTYENVVVDCDPGTEIFPRKILDEIANFKPIDHLLIVIDGSKMSLDTAKDIVEEAKKSNLKVKNVACIGNRVDDKAFQEQVKEVAKNRYGLNVVGFIPTDHELSKMSLTDQNVFEVKDSSAFQALKTVMRNLNL